MNDRLAHWLVDKRLSISLANLVFLVACCVGLMYLQFNGSYKIFFDEDNEHLLAHEQNEATYVKSNNLLFIFAVDV